MAKAVAPTATGADIARQIVAIERHLAECVLCRQFRPLHLRNPQCNTLRLLVDVLLRRWRQVPASQSARQMSIFDRPLDDDLEPAEPPF